MLIKPMTGQQSISKLYGDTIFDITSILIGQRGSVLVSQCAAKKMHQSSEEDTFILKGWDHNPMTRGKIWYFVCEEER
jgi:hypothetical protein